MEESKIECPVCKQVISDFDEGETNPCEHVMLTYVDICNGEFVYSAKEAEELEGLLVARYEHYYESDDCEDRELNEVMVEYADENEGYVVIDLTTYGCACGPCSSTEYNLIKLK
jgi:hypothetical protein